MKLRHAICLVSFVVIIAYAVYYIGSLGVRTGPPEDRVAVSMQLSDLNGLVVDSNVLLRGVPVGKVTGIDTTIQSATVHFYIDGHYPVPVDSEVRLENLSALGETYLGLMPRTDQGPMFHDGQQVATRDIKQPASISELAATVVRVLNQMDPDQVNRLVDEADRALPDEETVLPNLTRSATLLRNTVKDMNGTGSEVLGNLQTLLENAGFVGPILAQIGPDLRDTGADFHSAMWTSRYAMIGSGSPKSIQNMGVLLGRIQKFLDDRAPDFKVIAETLMPSINGIAAAAMNIDTGQMLSNMLETVPEDGVITLRVTTPVP